MHNAHHARLANHIQHRLWQLFLLSLPLNNNEMKCRRHTSKFSFAHAHKYILQASSVREHETHTRYNVHFLQKCEDRPSIVWSSYLIDSYSQQGIMVHEYLGFSVSVSSHHFSETSPFGETEVCASGSLIRRTIVENLVVCCRSRGRMKER